MSHFVTFVLISFAVSVYGWSCPGHMLVGEIARQLSPQAAAFFQPDIDYWAKTYSNIATMPEASCWGDDMKSFNTSCADWHYYDGCFNPDGTTCPSNPDGELLIKLPVCVQVLSDSSSSQDDRSFYLMFLLHLLGDSHQPLHAATLVSKTFPNGDQGGNAFLVKYGSNSQERLHAFCDAIAMSYSFIPQRPFSSNPSSQQFVQTTATNLLGNFTFPSSETEYEGNFTTWVSETFNAAATSVYLNGTLVPHTKLSNTYIKSLQYTLQRQIALGGRRLSSVLNYIYKLAQEKKAAKAIKVNP